MGAFGPLRELTVRPRSGERLPSMNRHDRVLESVIEAIGETPLVELRRLGRALDGRILAKLEYLNPGFSKKDRIARQIVEDAEVGGLLHAEEELLAILPTICGKPRRATTAWIPARASGFPS